MKSTAIFSLSLLTGIALAASEVVLESFAPYVEDFNNFRGTEDTLPVGFSFEVSNHSSRNNPPIFRGEFNSTTSDPDDFTGIMAATPDNENYSFVWRERTGAVDLDDARILIAIKNDTGSPIFAFNIAYDLQAWVNGRRDNELRFKYDIFPNTAAAPGRNAFENDIWPRNSEHTRNPNHTPISANGDQFNLNGQEEPNFVRVSGTIDLTTLLIDEDDPSAGFFGPLEDGETAYFRWQISNNQLTSGNRSALGIDNLVITPLATPPPTAPVLEWKPGIGGSGTWQPVGGTNWDDGEWEQEATALFDGPQGTVTLDGELEASDINLLTGYTFEATGGSSLFVNGVINVANATTATLGAPLRSDNQLRKQGAGTLVLSSPQTHTSATNIFAGILGTSVDDAHSPNAAMTITPGAIFDLDGTTQTVAGLNGQRGTEVRLGNGGTLILDIPFGSFAFRDDISGNGNIIKRGLGTQRFRSENKTYTGFTLIEEGSLEVTGNGEMSHTSAIDIMPEGELFFVGDSSSGPPQEFGAPISLRGGRLAFQNIDEEALYFVDTEVQILEEDSTINVSGSESIAIFNQGFGGVITGESLFRKTGAGALEMEGSHSHTGGMEIRNGSVVLISGSSLGSGPLRFTTSSDRGFLIQNSGYTATLLDGSATDPDEEDAENNLFMQIGSGATFTVNQAMILNEEDEEISTRFQGAIEGAGNFVKDGDGFLRFTRWAKNYTGSTTIRQGVLAVSESAALGNTSSVTVESGGQLRLTTSGEDVTYAFGGPLSLQGSGRGGDVTPASGQGILGALRYEPGNDDNHANLTNNISLSSDDSVALHVSGGTNTLVLTGLLSGTGIDPILKTGGGLLRVTGNNPDLNKPWSISNGRLEVTAGSSLGNGSVVIEPDGVLIGRGSIGGDFEVGGTVDLETSGGSLNVGGDMNLLAGGSLILALPVSQPRLTIDGTAFGNEDAIIQLDGDVAAGNYPIFSATAVSGEEPEILGVPEGLVATLDFVESEGILYLILSDSDLAGFESWIVGYGLDPADSEPLATPANDGVSNLLKYALGVDPLDQATALLPLAGVMDIDGDDYFTFEVVVRSDDPSLEIDAEGSDNLIDWTLTIIELDSVDQTGVASGFARRAWRTADPVSDGRAFLRLRASLISE